MALDRPISLPDIECYLRDKNDQLEIYQIDSNPCLLRAFEAARKVFINCSGLEGLQSLARAADRDLLQTYGNASLPDTHIQACTYGFFTNIPQSEEGNEPSSYLFPVFHVDETMTSADQFGHHWRGSKFDERTSRVIKLNATLVKCGTAAPENPILAFRIFHTINNGIAHAFLTKFLSRYIEGGVQLKTPPGVTYLGNTRSDSSNHGDAGAWFENELFGGALFYGFASSENENGNRLLGPDWRPLKACDSFTVCLSK
ncbi:hypothetical protein ABW21_db0202160 [Orbilia brochopaga]|nr:hypothetical protein ABW21_db0202160 [Drechslerella brochopaga]